jgi:hypothetical protein
MSHGYKSLQTGIYDNMAKIAQLVAVYQVEICDRSPMGARREPWGEAFS